MSAEVVERIQVRGRSATPREPATLLLEVPHGATARAELDAAVARLRGRLPEGIEDFFLVNTDAGAPELALAVAQGWVAAHEDRVAVVLRCRVPRTVVDCNRVLDPADRGGLTPGLPPYVRDLDDQVWLRAQHAAWQRAVEWEVDAVAGRGGFVVSLHTYAPRSVAVEVDDAIVLSLRAAWAEERRESWPLRSEVDLIVRDPEGVLRADAGVVAALVRAFALRGVTATESATYTLHPVTPPHGFALRWPGQTLCLEVRRDLLTERWEPFAPLLVAPQRVSGFADALVEGLALTLRSRP